jgi:putative peptidoglycan lipid II flippase
MSRLVDARNWDGLRESLATSLRATALLAIPASVGLAVLAQPILALIFQTGRFSAADVAWTASTLRFQCLGLLFVATSRILAQSLYALKDYRTPAYAALAGVGANLVLSFLLMKPFGTGGIALANGLASLVGLGFLLPTLARKLERLPVRRVIRGGMAMAAASTAMGLFAWYGQGLLDLRRFHGVLGTSLRLFPLIAVSALLYFGLLLLLRVPEALALGKMALRKLRLTVGE